MIALTGSDRHVSSSTQVETKEETLRNFLQKCEEARLMVQCLNAILCPTAKEIGITDEIAARYPGLLSEFLYPPRWVARPEKGDKLTPENGIRICCDIPAHHSNWSTKDGTVPLVRYARTAEKYIKEKMTETARKTEFNDQQIAKFENAILSSTFYAGKSRSLLPLNNDVWKEVHAIAKNWVASEKKDTVRPQSF